MSPAVENIQLLTWLTESHMSMKSYKNETGFPHIQKLGNRNRMCSTSALVGKESTTERFFNRFTVPVST